MPTWQLVIDDRAGAARAFVNPTKFTLTRRRNDGADLQFELPTDSDGAAVLDVGARRVRAYRDGVLRFHGDVDEPMTTAARSNDSTVTVVARDPWAELQRWPLTDVASYAQEDAGQIAADLVDLTEAAIVGGTIAPSVPRDRIYDTGKLVGEAIAQLAEVDDGFHFYVDPVEYDDSGARPVVAHLTVRYPTAGTDHPEVRFEYGDGTMANLSGFSEELRLPRNYVLALGAVIDPTNEVQRFVIGEEVQGDIGGTFTMTFDGQTTGNIAYNASASTVQAALEGLSNISPGDVSVSNGDWTALGSYHTTLNIEVTFQGAYEGVNVPQVNLNVAGITQSLGASGAAWGTKTQGSPGTSGQPLSAIAQDTASQDAYGVRPEALTWTDVVDPTTLNEYAVGAIIPAPQAVYTVEATPEAPVLFDDFNVGDLVRLRIAEGRVDVAATLRVDEASVTVDESGVELLSLVLATESVRRLGRRQGDRFFDSLRRLGSRVGALERRA